MTYCAEIEIKGLPKITPNRRDHWAVRAAEAKKWRSLVAALFRPLRPPVPLTQAVLTLTRVSSTAPDSDNLAASFKSVVDSLIDAGVIVNDKFVNIGMPRYQWEPGKRGQGFIRVKVEGVPSETK